MKKRDPVERFHEKYMITAAGCWQWQGAKIPSGYGKFRVGTVRDGSRRTVQAHRWYYEQLHGPVDPDLEMDHLCRNRTCVNPAHVEPVTRSENQRRGLGGIRRDYCQSGRHRMNEENVYTKPDGRRVCRKCKNEKTNAWKRNKRISDNAKS